MTGQDRCTDRIAEAQPKKIIRKLYKGSICLPSDFVRWCHNRRVIVYINKFLVYEDRWRGELNQERSIEIFPYQIFMDYEQELVRLLKDNLLEMRELERLLGANEREAQIQKYQGRLQLLGYELEYIQARKDSLVLVTLKADRIQIKNPDLEAQLLE